ncbi:gamma-glutamylcyclotransferase family protein [Chelativorans sp. YIM 93263]|uniref:gamma-glutamylcyclotransferase family protein n=1 Tax=Chelativorans sp. YIM 93263 TaxID=2906648 RepID=UPI002378DB3E|nr:gamma-glutamylcyclotransferase family protein [Chelativorans sp. YIM 93263]
MAVIQYFAYGSNMSTERLRGRCVSARPLEVACAEGWSFSFSKIGRDGSGKATIAAAPDSRVFGVVYELDENELPNLDLVEGAGQEYSREDRFSVFIGGAPREVVTYIALPSRINTSLKPSEWYLDFVITGARQHRLPPHYIDLIEAAANPA